MKSRPALFSGRCLTCTWKPLELTDLKPPHGGVFLEFSSSFPRVFFELALNFPRIFAGRDAHCYFLHVQKAARKLLGKTAELGVGGNVTREGFLVFAEQNGSILSVYQVKAFA